MTQVMERSDSNDCRDKQQSRTSNLVAPVSKRDSIHTNFPDW